MGNEKKSYFYALEVERAGGLIYEETMQLIHKVLKKGLPMRFAVVEVYPGNGFFTYIEENGSE